MDSAEPDTGNAAASFLLQDGGCLSAQAAAMLRLTRPSQPRDSFYAPWQLQRLAALTATTAEAIDRAARLTALLHPADWPES